MRTARRVAAKHKNAGVRAKAMHYLPGLAACNSGKAGNIHHAYRSSSGRCLFFLAEPAQA